MNGTRQLSAKKKTPLQMQCFLRGAAREKGIVEALAQADDLDSFRYYRGLCEVPKEAQQVVLQDILRRNASSEFGKAHDFGSLRDVASFRARVPISDWPSYDKDAERMRHGETDVLFTGATPYFLITSGTTGQAKYLPESEAGAKAKSITGRLRIAAIAGQAPSALKGALLPLSNSPSYGMTEGGIPIGSASGLTLAATPEAIRNRMAFPIEVLSIDDPAAMDYALLRFSLAQDVRAIVTNNAGRAEPLFAAACQMADSLIDDIEKGSLRPDIPIRPDLRETLCQGLAPDPARAEALRALQRENRFLPRYYWPNLVIFSCWLSGSIGRFVTAVQDSLPAGCRFFDCGYGASEGKFNVPLLADSAAGPLALHAAFYEFLPMDGGEPLLASELQDQTSYHLIVTTYSGLYRYNLHDVVFVNGFTGQTPNIRFERKSGETYNIVGEKMSVPVIVHVFSLLPDELKKQIRHYAVAPEDEERRYCFFLEPFPGDEPDETRLGDLLEAAMMKVSIAYALYRNQGILHPCRIVLMRPGWQESLYEARRKPGQTTAQIKLPVLMLEQPDRAFCMDAV